MQHGLDGRRVAVFGGKEADALKAALEGAGALVEVLSDGRARSEAEWHGGRYAAIVVGSPRDDALQSRIVQLVREFLLSGKPVLVTGDGVGLLEEAGGTREDAVVVPNDLRAEGSSEVIRLLADRFEDSQVDEMSDMSFPASDPPSVSPASIGPDSPDSEAR